MSRVVSELFKSKLERGQRRKGQVFSPIAALG
jgi:hypothetical protein